MASTSKYGSVVIHRMMINIWGPSSEKYIKEETFTEVQKGMQEFDETNQKIHDSLDFSEVERILNEQLPEGFKAKVSDF